jgi:hypothetical protein
MLKTNAKDAEKNAKDGKQDGKTGTLEELLIGSALVMNSALANLKSKNKFNWRV